MNEILLFGLIFGTFAAIFTASIWLSFAPQRAVRRRY
jgi:hypothetical protein